MTAKRHRTGPERIVVLRSQFATSNFQVPLRQLENEIAGESIRVPLYRLIKTVRVDAVGGEGGWVCVDIKFALDQHSRRNGSSFVAGTILASNKQLDSQ